MKNIYRFLLIILLTYFNFCGISYLIFLPSFFNSSQEKIFVSEDDLIEIKESPNLALIEGNFSSYILSVKLDETTSSVQGNLSVDFYNNDAESFEKLPFHLYLSGMEFESRIGNIEILNVTKADNSDFALTFEVDSGDQIMWVTLDTTLESFQRVSFIIRFIATLPDGGIDRANSHGDDYNQSRIYKVANFYPMPCVYDEYDGWNIDPYLEIGDPFYFDMAYYNLFVEVPTGFVVAATGKLVEKKVNGLNALYHFDTIYPIREVTFSTSKYFKVDSKIVNGVNISTYYLPKSQSIWKNYALDYGINAFTLYNEIFGIYPYPTFNIVEEYSFFGGMEYPNQVYITESIDYWEYPQWFLEKFIVHETSHQWWYNLVGNDEVDLGFLDEMLACWSTDYYTEIYHSDWKYFQYELYIDEVRTYYAKEELPNRINQSIYECYTTYADYWYIAYKKAPLILEKFRNSIGDVNFFSGLKLFFERYQYKIALLSDLQQCFEDIIGTSLDWFFLPWFDNPYLPSYVFTSVIYDLYQSMLYITVEDLNEANNNYPYSQQIPLQVYDANGEILFNEIVWINSTTTFSIPVTINPTEVSLIYNENVLVQLSSVDIESLKAGVENPVIVSIIIIIIITCSVSVGLLIIFKILRKRKKILMEN